MERFLFIALLIGVAVGTPLRKDNEVKGDPECLIGNQDIAEYFGVEEKDVIWTRIKTMEDWEAVKANIELPKSMLVIDVFNKNDVNMIDEDFKLETFLGEVIKQLDKNKKYGVKYNILDVDAYKKMLSTYERVKKPIMPPIPQIFHINADSLKDAGYKLIKDVLTAYKTNNQYKCYTYSFGWQLDVDGCTAQQLKQEDFDTLKTEMDKFTDVFGTIVELDWINRELNTAASKIAYKLSMDKLRCYSQRSLNTEITEFKEHSEDMFFDMDAAAIQKRSELCEANKGILDHFKNEADLAKIQWKLVTQMDELKAKVAAGVVKMDVEDEKILGGNFKTALTEYRKKNAQTSLLLNLKNTDAIELFAALSTEELELLRDIPFGVQVTSEFPYDDNKWIDCYTAAISPVSADGKTAYKEAELNALKSQKIASPERIYPLVVEKLALTEQAKVEELTGSHKLIKLDVAETSDIKTARKMLRVYAAASKAFFDAAEEVRTKAQSPVKAADFFPGSGEDKRIVQFVATEDCQDLTNVEGSMVQLTIEKITNAKFEKCLEKLNENDKNGLQLKLKNIPDKAALEKSIKYLNYPVWIQLNVEDVQDFSKLARSEWYYLLVGMTKADSLAKLQAAVKAVPAGENFAVSVNAKDYITEAAKIDELVKDGVDMMLSIAAGEELVTGDLRTKLGEKKPYFDHPVKYVLDACPVNDVFAYFSDIEDLSEDLSLLKFSDVLDSEEAIAAAVQSGKDMLSLEIITEKTGKLVTAGVDLKEMLQKEKELPATTRKFGLKLTFDDVSYNKALEDPTVLESLRVMKRPIWINVIGVNDKKPFGLKYSRYNDLIDCRTLSLGFGGNSPYTAENVAALKKLSAESGPNAKIYVVELVHIGHVWDIVNPLLEGNNYITLLWKVGEDGKVDYDSMDTVLEENKGKFFYDLPDVVRNLLHGGVAALSASLLLATILATFAIVF